ncbi:MAG: serine/threonine protein kinase [Deltaproteobacteria bacterium]|nr:serine/threonine protein kinase [Deltaproteobacteria bacterium]
MGGPGKLLEAGSIVGKYRVVRQIGEGGMATIYLAASAGPDGFSKPCALKLIRPELTHIDQVSRTLIQEAKIAALLNHPNIVQVFDFGLLGSDYFLTMEWVDGATLGEVLMAAIRTKSLPGFPVACYVAHALAEALAFLEAGLVVDGERIVLIHRDLSPSNVLISNTGAVKLTDFGIVKVLEEPAATNLGVVKGKYAYMSPEQIRGEALDPRSDQFALGILLFETLTATRLFRRKTLAATVAAVNAARVPPPSSINPAVPPEIDAIVLKALARHRDDRYASAGEIAEALWPFAAEGRRRIKELISLVALVGATHAHGRRRLRLDEVAAQAAPDPGPDSGPLSPVDEIEIAEAPATSAEEFAMLDADAGEDAPIPIDVAEEEAEEQLLAPAFLKVPPAVPSVPPRSAPFRSLPPAQELSMRSDWGHTPAVTGLDLRSPGSEAKAALPDWAKAGLVALLVSGTIVGFWLWLLG